MQAGIPCPPEHRSKSSAPAAADNADEPEPDPEIHEVTVITSSPPKTPPPPRLLPKVDFVIIFVINGKEIGERNILIDVNQDFEAFRLELNELVDDKLPGDLTLFGSMFGGPTVVFKRVYVTKSQSLKRKELAWTDFTNEQDYAGLVNVIRDSKQSKMTLVVRALVTVPQEDFEEQVQPLVNSQRVV
jgi:hypothetical protein